MDRIIDYKVVHELTSINLETKVQELIKKGYQPNVEKFHVMIDINGCFHYYQPMVKYEKII